MGEKKKYQRPLSGEQTLEEAEGTLQLWATILAKAGRDQEAAEGLRIAAAILEYRCSFLESEKRH